MEEKNIQTKKPEKLSYEQLENVAHQLDQQVKDLYTKLQEANIFNMLKRLEFLFKVIEYSDRFDKDFVTKCTNEIVSIMTLQNPDTANTSNGNSAS